MASSVAFLPQVPCKCEPMMDSRLDYREPVMIDKKTRALVEQQARPLNGLTGHPFEIVLEDQENEIVTQGMTLHTKLKISKADKSAWADDEPAVAPINNIAASLWERIRTKVNDHEINSEGSSHIAVKVLVNNMLSYNPAPAEQLAAAGFEVEEKGANVTSTGEENKTFTSRCAEYVKSKEVMVSCALPVDVSTLSNFLAPGNKLSFEFYRSSEDFHLMAENGTVKWKTEITDVFIQYYRVVLEDQAQESLESAAKSQYLGYQLDYTEVKSIEVPKGVSNWVLPVYPAGHVLPKQIHVMQAATKNLESVTKNPLAFPHMNLTYLCPKINDETPPYMAREPNFAKKLVSLEYYRMFQHTGKARSADKGLLITKEMFQNNHAIFPFDLSYDRCNGGHLHVGRRGKLDLVMGWGSPLANPTTVLVYSIFDQLLTVDPKTKLPIVQYV